MGFTHPAIDFVSKNASLHLILLSFFDFCRSSRRIYTRGLLKQSESDSSSSESNIDELSRKTRETTLSPISPLKSTDYNPFAAGGSYSSSNSQRGYSVAPTIQG